MAKLQLKTQSLPKRCEICHKADFFDSVNNICVRCKSVSVVRSTVDSKDDFKDNSEREKLNNLTVKHLELWLVSCLCLIISSFGFFFILGTPSPTWGDPPWMVLLIVIVQISPVLFFQDNQNKKRYLEQIVSRQLAGIIGMVVAVFLGMAVEIIQLDKWVFPEVYETVQYVFNFFVRHPYGLITYGIFLWPIATLIFSSAVNVYGFTLLLRDTPNKRCSGLRLSLRNNPRR